MKYISSHRQNQNKKYIQDLRVIRISKSLKSLPIGHEKNTLFVDYETKPTKHIFIDTCGLI